MTFYRIIAMGAGAGAWIYGLNWWMSLILALGVYGVIRPETGPNRLIQVINLDDGTVKTQPMDAAGAKYLQTRD